MPSEAETAFREAIKGLLYMSETDAPFKLVRWEKSIPQMTPTALLALSKNDPRARVEEQTLDEFFTDLVRDESESAEQYKCLLTTLQKHLTNLRVYRIGQVEIGVYILGEAEGDWQGVKTKAVET